jgi:phage terminase large subunit-like protein
MQGGSIYPKPGGSNTRNRAIEGESGILATAHPSFRPHWNKHLNHLEWPNGSKAIVYSAHEPESLRGPNNGFAWVDELFKFRYQQQLWDELVMTMRSGANPQVLVTSTPRPTRLCKELVKDKNNVVTDGSMGENDALPQRFVDAIQKKYGGTRRGRQEIDGEILEDNPGALWKQDDIDAGRVKEKDEDGNYWKHQMDRIVVAIDPATTSNEETSDATGIIVVGRKGDQGYVFSDDTLVATPSEWGKAGIEAYNLWKADRMVAETNNGGDMVETIIRNIQNSVSYRKVHATRGKAIRAEPVASLYEQGRIHHVGEFDELETEMREFDPGLGRDQKSPNRMDALVWGFAELFGDCFVEPKIIDLDDSWD